MTAPRADRIAKMLAEADLSVAWLARRVGLKKATLHTYLTGTSEPKDAGVWDKLEEAIPPQLLGKPANIVTYPPQSMRYAGEVPAGDWGDPLESEEFIDVDPALFKSNRFAARVVGYSCAPALLPHDLTIWECDLAPKPGLIVLAQNKGEHLCTVKELQFDPEAMRPRLVPLNPEYSEPADGDGWGVIARLVAIVRTEDGMRTTRYRAEGITSRVLLD